MHNYDLVDRLSKQLWDIRFRLAQSIVSPIPDHDKITTAQRILDRLVFLYFIASKGIIRESKETGSECGPKVKSLFGRIVRSSTDFYATLNNIFYKYLNSPDRNRMTIEGQQNLTLRIPYLIGNLFSEKILSSSAGEIQESELAIEAFDWSQLIAELNKYNWVIDSSQAAEPNDMTPAILGHIYEKFVIAMTKIKEIDNLEQLQTSSKGEIRKGKKKIGTHYTPPDIANYIGRSTIFPYAADQIGKNDYNSFDQFIDEYENDSETLDAFAKELQHIRVLDPAVGSGHFLMAAANLLLKLRKQCGDETPEYDLRRDIITNNLFGVDIMEGAVEICKLRLWLWLLAVQDSSQDPDPLPNLDYNIKAGNSLIGVSGKDIPDAISTDVQRYGQSISQYRADEAEKAKLNKETRMLYPKIKSQLDESYLKATNAKLMLEFQSLEEANDALVVGTDSDATLGLKFRQAMAEDLKRCLDSAGFKTWKKTAKMEVNLQNLNAHRLSEIREAIDNYYGIDHVILQRRPTIEDLRVIEPFHWILEFPDIFETKREFDVIIGNPPYGDLCNARERAFMAGRYRTATYNEISANFIERQIETLLREGGYFGNITTSSILANSTMHELHNTIRQNLTDVHTSVFARRPSKVFRNAEINVAITTGRK
ncbi:MAG: N-6 DNA methylase, partial [Candidatus Thorarchaeota archaeon]|nr:N-6 DNA methylase [Candidatus Thorarchaeota archaeon]